MAASDWSVSHLSPVVLEHDHAGLGVHPPQCEGLPVEAPHNHRGHHLDKWSGDYSMIEGHVPAPVAQDQALLLGWTSSCWPGGHGGHRRGKQ